MSLYALNAISPVDGRYQSKTKELSSYYSEAALIKYRLRVEVEYFISLCELPLPQLENFDAKLYEPLRKIYLDFSDDDAQEVKEIESITNHDVKAVEYFLKERFDRLKISEYKEFIHFALTSQDINNTATPLLIKESVEDIFLPNYLQMMEKLIELKDEWANIPLLARTHGQAASPTLLGKEIMVFIERLERQMGLLNIVPFSAKFGGATGNFNAHHIAYPEVDWVAFSNEFVEETLGLDRSQVTTQIEHYDNLAALFDNFKRINTILIDLSRDIWTYISMNYFKQKIKKGEVGSSAMPHKVNPIDFENGEGNLGISNTLFEFFANKLTKSRHQRDLSDSTVLRNVGLGFGYSVLSIKSILKGMNKIDPNIYFIENELNNNWEVLAEAVQTIMRFEGIPDAYEQLKDLSRGSKLDSASYIKFVNNLNISAKSKKILTGLTPSTYIGLSSKLSKSLK